MSRVAGRLWQQPAFRSLWAAQVVSHGGSQLTSVAVPLTAVLLLKASPAQMGLLVASERLVALVFGLIAGAWVDRLPRRTVMRAADLGRAVALLAVPVAALLGALRLELLFAVSLVTGLLTMCAELASSAYLPAVVDESEIPEANARLETARSVIGAAGPGVGGALAQVVMAPVLLGLDACSYLLSALFLGRIRTAEPAPLRDRAPMAQEIRDGVRLVWRDPVLRAMAGCTATFNGFASLGAAVVTLHLLQGLGLEPMEFGLLAAAGGPGAALGAMVAAPLARRWGLGPTLMGGLILSAVGMLLVPLATGPREAQAAVLCLSGVLAGVWGPIWGVNVLSLRQQLTPGPYQARVTATIRTLVWGVMFLGALVGGMLGEVIGTRATLLVSAAGILLAIPWVGLTALGRADRALTAVADDRKSANWRHRFSILLLWRGRHRHPARSRRPDTGSIVITVG